MTENAKKVLDYLSENKVTVPTEVKNAITDLFDELVDDDTKEELNPEVLIYFKEDKDEFISDMTLTNNSDIFIDKGSEGNAYEVYTYYGDLTISKSEFTKVCSESEGVLKDDVVVVDNRNIQTRLDTEDFAVLILENNHWGNGEFETEYSVLIYCPVEGS